MYTIWQTCTCILLSCLDHVHACIHCTCIYVSPYKKKPHVKKARASVCMVHVRTYGHRWCHSPQASSPCCFISNQVSPCFSCYFFLCACLDCRTREDLEMRHMIRNQTMRFRLSCTSLCTNPFTSMTEPFQPTYIHVHVHVQCYTQEAASLSYVPHAYLLLILYVACIRLPSASCTVARSN